MGKILIFLQRLFLSTRWLSLINISLSALLGYYAVQLALQLNHSPSFPKIHTQLNSVYPDAQVMPARPALDISALLNAHLFGEANAVTVQTAPVSATPPETKLDLKLQGIFYSSDPEIAQAVITTADGKSARYRTGQTIGNATIDKIHPKTVILLRNQRSETLPLIDIKADVKNTLSNREISSPTTNATTSTAPASSDLKPEKLLGTYQQELLANPAGLSQLLRLSAASENGNFIGYRLNPGKDANLMAKFNLQAGDILTTVNGIALDSPMKGLTVVQQLTTTDQLNLQLLRNGQPISLSFMIEK